MSSVVCFGKLALHVDTIPHVRTDYIIFFVHSPLGNDTAVSQKTQLFRRSKKLIISVNLTLFLPEFHVWCYCLQPNMHVNLFSFLLKLFEVGFFYEINRNSNSENDTIFVSLFKKGRK